MSVVENGGERRDRRELERILSEQKMHFVDDQQKLWHERASTVVETCSRVAFLEDL